MFQVFRHNGGDRKLVKKAREGNYDKYDGVRDIPYCFDCGSYGHSFTGASGRLIPATLMNNSDHMSIVV